MTFFQKILISFVFSVSFVLVAWAAEDSAQAGKNDKAPEEPSTVNGEKVYLDNCSICHGDKGDGNTRAKSGLRPPPRDFTTISAALELSRERMIESVTHGRPGTGMMPHKDRISKAEIEAVVDYVRTVFMQTPDQARKSDLSQHVDGEKIYSKNCSVCHGDKGTGALWAQSGLNPKPRDFTTSAARTELNRERMISSVTNGRPGTAMMPHKDKLSGKEIQQVVDYIRAAYMSGPAAPASQASIVQPQMMNRPSPTEIAKAHRGMNQIQQGAAHPGMPPLAGKGAGSGVTQSGRLPMPGATMPSDHAATGRMPGMDPHQGPHSGGAPAMQARIGPVIDVDMKAPMPKGLKGNADQGRQFYMGNCYVCHGIEGDGNGPRAHFNTPRPRNFTSDASKRMLNRERLFNSITKGKVGTVMPAWGKVLNDQQIANVAEFVFTHFIQAKAADKNTAEKKTN